MAKLLKLRRGSTSQHGSFTGAEGEVTVDTDKDTLVVHDGSQAGGRPLLREDMSNLPAGTIDNADVNASAAIAGTKISPNFGSQNIVTTGTLGSSDLTITSVAPALLFTETNGDPDYKIQSNAGVLKIIDNTNSANRLVVNADGHIDVAGNLDVGANLDVTGTLNSGNLTVTGVDPVINLVDSNNNSDFSIFGNGGVFTISDSTNTADRFEILSDGTTNVNANLNVSSGLDVTGDITVTGTVDGVDLAALNLTAASLSSVNGSLANGVTATTQSANDNSTKVATTAYTDTAISNLVDSSPAALNTLNELAAALGDDANFSTTVNNNIAAKMPTGGGVFVGDVTFDGETAGRDILFDRSENKFHFADNAKAVFGESSDLQFYHSGTNNVIDSTNTWLNINSDGGVAIRHEIQADGSDGENMALFKPDGAVELYHDDSKKFETSSTGVSVTGALVASGDVTAFSDQTLKKDITTINDALGLCGKLRGVSYKWIKDDKPSIGVIAQEIEQHIPEIVSTTQLDGKDVKSVDYGKIVGVLINAVNELKAELDEYKATFEDLRTSDIKTPDELDKIILVRRKVS